MTRFCRALGLLGLAVFLSLATAGAATASPAVHGKTCPINTSCITTNPGGGSKIPGTHGHGTTRYCVSGYKPGSVVTITNPVTGVTQRVTIGANGDACTVVTLGHGCQTITARGTGANGTPTSSSGRVCQTVTTQPANGVLPFTGSSLIVPGTAAGLVLLAGGSILVVFARRRRVSALS